LPFPSSRHQARRCGKGSRDRSQPALPASWPIARSATCPPGSKANGRPRSGSGAPGCGTSV